MSDAAAQPVRSARRRERSRQRRAERAVQRRTARQARACEAPRAPAFPERWHTYENYRRAISSEVWNVAMEELPRGKMRRAFKRRATRIKYCGTVMRVRRCSACGDARPGSGVLGSYAEKCEARGCPVCARARSASVREWLGRAMDHARNRMVEAQGRDDGRRWKHITLTLQRDPSDRDGHRWEVLRARLRALQAAWRAIWKSWKAIPGAAALLTIEIAGTGNVHAHALVLGPRSVAKSWLSETVGEHAAHCSDSMTPFVDVRTVDHATAIRELSAYHAKMPTILQEGWLAGCKAKVMHPRLAARWEVACYNQRLRERFGTLREVPLDESTRHGEELILSAEEKAEADTAAHCESCGSVAGFQWGFWESSIQSWVGHCWARDGTAIARPMARSELEHASAGEREAIEQKDEKVLTRSIRRGQVRAWWAGRSPRRGEAGA